jgi:uncharacterized membrane protein YdjX (TVP38/TMEM64 family)
MNTENPGRPSKQKRILAWLKKQSVPLAGLVFSLAIFFILGFLYIRNHDIFDNLKSYGYAGVFVLSLFLNATIIVPVSAMTVIAALGATLPLPWLVGVIGGIGAGIGEVTAYIAGRSGRALVAKNKVFQRVEKWVQKWGFVAIFFLSIVPFIFDVVGITAGVMKMPVWKFMVATWLGRTISYVAVAYLGKTLLDAIPFLH